MISFLSVLLGLALVAVLIVLIAGVVVFASGGEVNRRYANRLMNLRVATQAVAVLILGLIVVLRALH
ncbi:MAG TPA: HIG1 domain-containing protein [Patescibacteria group bacterium]|nr:HIG1 domain-containing protein [Patescibacteria group bacterium]